MARIVKYIFICLFAVFLMSHNTFAYDLSRDVQFYASKHFTLQAYGASSSSWAYLDNNKCIRATGTVAFNNIALASIPYTETKAGDYIQFWLTIGINAENNSTDTMLRGVYLNDTHFKTVATEYSNLNGSNGMLTITARVENDYAFSGEILLGLAGGSPTWVLYNNEYVYAGEITFWRPMSNTFSSQDIVNAINNQTNYTQALNDIKDKMDEEKEAAEDATEQAETDSDASQSSVDGATTNLIGALGSIGSALTNAPATDCIIDINTRQFSVGRVNLCSNVPQEVLTFTSGLLAIVLTPIVLYYVFHIITYMYNLFQEFQR